MTNRSAKPRLLYLDNLKAFLAILVVMHHAGQPYGPGGSWWIPPEPTQMISLLILGLFFSVNASFFMGLFFMISAYFVPSSYDRKGAITFLKERLVRLGVPMVIFSLGVFPTMIYLLYWIGQASFLDFYRNTYLNFGGPGSLTLSYLWFLELLLVFSALYVILRVVTGGRSVLPKVKFPTGRVILVFTVVLALSMFIVRIWFPINQWILLSVEPADLPEYVAFFAIGILASRNEWLNGLPASTAKKWSRITGIAVPMLLVIFLLFGLSMLDGGLTVASLAYSVWESVVCVGMSISLLALFRVRFNFQGKVAKILADNSFTVYLIHVPIIVFLQYLLIDVNVHPLAKFAVVSLVGVPACFLISNYIIRKLPYVNRVL